jgi:hypothetical protein
VRRGSSDGSVTGRRHAYRGDPAGARSSRLSGGGGSAGDQAQVGDGEPRVAPLETPRNPVQSRATKRERTRLNTRSSAIGLRWQREGRQFKSVRPLQVRPPQRRGGLARYPTSPPARRAVGSRRAPGLGEGPFRRQFSEVEDPAPKASGRPTGRDTIPDRYFGCYGRPLVKPCSHPHCGTGRPGSPARSVTSRCLRGRWEGKPAPSR